MVEHILCTTCVSICVLCILCMDSNSVFAVQAAAATCCNNYMLVFAQLLLCNLILWIGFLTLSPYFCDYWFFGWISINVINLTYNLLNAVLSGVCCLWKVWCLVLFTFFNIQLVLLCFSMTGILSIYTYFRFKYCLTFSI